MTTADDAGEDAIAEGYLANAQYWIDVVRSKRDRYQQELTDPALMAAVGTCSGSAVLDVGCGEGSFTHRLLDTGAQSVHGIDACLPLIAAARDAYIDDRLTFTHAEVDALPLSDGGVDVVVANRLPHALTHPERRFAEFRRVLRADGRLILLSQHPCFYTGLQAMASSNSLAAVQDYFAMRVVRRKFSVDGHQSPAPSVQPIYSLSQYLTMVTDAGFAITGVTEPHPTDAQFRDPWWSDNFTRPMFLLVTCTAR